MQEARRKSASRVDTQPDPHQQSRFGPYRITGSAHTFLIAPTVTQLGLEAEGCEPKTGCKSA